MTSARDKAHFIRPRGNPYPIAIGREILEFVERVEDLSLFQDRIEKPARIPQVWKAFGAEIERLVTPSAMALFLVDAQTNSFELDQWIPSDCDTIFQRELDAQIECGTFAWIVNRRQAAIIPSFVFGGPQNLVMLPLTTHSRTLGVAMIVTAIEEKSVTHERLRLLGILSKQCALVMENTLLFDHLKKEHEALQAAQTHIIQAEKFAAIGRLTSGVFHELLNPLNVISGHLQLMMMANGSKVSADDDLAVMKAASDRIAAIVNSLLRFSTKQPKTRCSVDCTRLLRKAAETTAARQADHRVRVVFAIDPGLPRVTVNLEDLETVARHLIDNACDAMPQGGILTIGARLLAPAQAPAAEPQIELSFADNGRGIADRDIHKIFDPFFTTKEVGQGTGLSLAISYALVCSMGGTLTFESRMKEGTVFSVRLPLTHG